MASFYRNYDSPVFVWYHNHNAKLKRNRRQAIVNQMMKNITGTPLLPWFDLNPSMEK